MANANVSADQFGKRRADGIPDKSPPFAASPVLETIQVTAGIAAPDGDDDRQHKGTQANLVRKVTLPCGTVVNDYE